MTRAIIDGVVTIATIDAGVTAATAKPLGGSVNILVTRTMGNIGARK
jgi:hypothetical protein